MSNQPLYPFLDTPALVLDLDKMEANIREMAQVAGEAGVGLRPHVKTHKSPRLARLQVEAGATGITVAKLGEAEVMAEAGLTDIRIAYPICGELKLARLKRLCAKARISLSLDSREVAEGISAIGEAIGKPIPVLLKINTGLDRCGVLPGEEALTLAARIDPLPGVDLVGILTHEGQALARERTPEGIRRAALEAGAKMVETADRLRSRGYDIREVSVGSTPTSRHIARVPGVTEIRPGTYIFNDRNVMGCGEARLEQCALRVLVTVVSIPADDRAVIDGGSKTFSSDRLAQDPGAGFGYVVDQPGVILERMSEEHGVLRLEHARARLRIGQRLEIIPNHVCPVVNLADSLQAVRQGRLEEEIPVLARGKNR